MARDAAYRPMLRLLRSDPEMIDALMGDGITECGARVVVSLFDGDLRADRRGGARPDAEEYVRGQMLDALAMLAVEHAPLQAGGRGRPAPVPRRASDTTPESSGAPGASRSPPSASPT